MNKQRWGGNTRQNDPQGGRERILQAAKHCYTETGVASTTIEDIANQAQVSRRTIYRYFDSKKAIIQTIVDEQSGDLLNLMREQVQEPSLSFIDQLQRYVLYMIKQGQQAPGYQVLLGQDNIRVTSEYYISSKATHLLLTKMLKPPLEEAQSKGEIRTDINCDQLIAWLGRIVFSYSHIPSHEKEAKEEIERFFTPALLPR